MPGVQIVCPATSGLGRVPRRGAGTWRAARPRPARVRRPPAPARGNLPGVDLRRLRHGEWIAGISGAVLLVAMFLDWYSAGGQGANAWESLTVIDVFLAIAGLFGIGLAAAAATQRTPAVPQAVGQLGVPFAFVAAILAVIRLLDLPGPVDSREIGLYIGVAATLATLVGLWRAIGDESFPREVATKVDVTPLPAPKPRSEPQTDE